MDRRPLAVMAVALLLVVSGCSVGYQADGQVPPPTEPPEADHPGFVDGYWYNDTFRVDASDGLTAREQRAVVARSMARVQVIRELRFNESVDVEFVTREEFRADYTGVFERNRSEVDRAFENAQYEALLLVGSDRDAIAVRQENRGVNVLGFYLPGRARIVIVSEGDVATLRDEATLVHELVHALQDQRFGFDTLEAATRDERAGESGLVEGDAVAIEHRYRHRCESGEWVCVEHDRQPVQPGGDFHWGVYFLEFFPYAEGPSFVTHHERRGGWGAIDEMYAAPPQSSRAVIYPETYGETTPAVRLRDRASAPWTRVEPSQGPDYAVLGQAGVATMFAYTLYDQSNASALIEQDAFLNREADGTLNRSRPFTYDITYAEGLAADRLHAYEHNGELAYVWRLRWTDPANASEFAAGYSRLVAYWGGDRVAQRTAGETWEIADGPFEGTYWIDRDGDRVTVVKVPPGAALEDVHPPAG